MAKRLTRQQQVVKNRAQVLESALRVFLRSGYTGATLEAIAEEAGFSKGVVYSQFQGKADLFLELLDARIEKRARQNERATKALHGADAFQALVRAGSRDARAEAGWQQLLIEFRTHAARDPELRARYAKAHQRTLAGVASALQRIFDDTGTTPVAPTPVLAQLMAALGAGLMIERGTDPNAIDDDALHSAFARMVGINDDEA